MVTQEMGSRRNTDEASLCPPGAHLLSSLVPEAQGLGTVSNKLGLKTSGNPQRAPARVKAPSDLSHARRARTLALSPLRIIPSKLPYSRVLPFPSGVPKLASGVAWAGWVLTPLLFSC